MIKALTPWQNNGTDFILASASPRRREILNMIGLKFRVVVSNVREQDYDLPPDELVCALARDKAEAVFADNPDSVVLAADTVVWIDNKILGKPQNRDDAVSMLKLLSGRRHEVYTGYCVLSRDYTACDYVRTSVYFKELSRDIINFYIDTGEPFDKAGGYGIQGKGALLVERIDGDYLNVVGLPVSKIFERDV